MKNARLWQVWYLRGWAVTLGIVLGWEAYAYASFLFGVWAFPTLSEIIVTTLGANRAIAATVVVALVLCWHWYEVEREIARRVASRRKSR